MSVRLRHSTADPRTRSGNDLGEANAEASADARLVRAEDGLGKRDGVLWVRAMAALARGSIGPCLA